MLNRKVWREAKGGGGQPTSEKSSSTPDAPVQSFLTDMFSISGGIAGNPDFDPLSFTGGTGNGLASPGHTVLQNRGDGTFVVDSFFDITYQIAFVGVISLANGFSATVAPGEQLLLGNDDVTCPLP